MPFRHWTHELTTEESNAILSEIALVHARRINDQTVRERLTSSITGGDILSLCDASPPYAQSSVYDCLNVRQISALFSKRADLELGIDKRAVAIKKFLESEALCAETNEIFRLRSDGRFSFRPSVESVLFSAQRKIASILGDLPSLSDLKLRFGPGATTHIKKKNANPLTKLGSPFSCSEDAIPLISDVLAEFPHWVDSKSTKGADVSDSCQVPLTICNGRLDFVRKSYKTDRAIVVEPMLNSMVQLGIGDYIAERLRRSGIDLRDQTRNKRLAREGSISGDYATLDLSSASDTVASGLVMDLLPYDWFDFMSHFRSSKIDCEGITVNQRKFSSMGNGFTFALESLIFYALAFASTPEELRSKVSVYGDDIIVPTVAYGLTVECLVAAGFIPNVDKSFATGPFRESCGGDYMRGIDIRPCYIKAALSPRSLFVLHNFYVRQNDKELADLVLSFIPTHFHKWGPDGYGDGHLVGDWIQKPHKRHLGWSGYTFESYTMKPRRAFQTLPGDTVYSLYTIYAEGSSDLGLDSWSPNSPEPFRAPTFKSSQSCYDDRGRRGITLPGADVYKLIKIYTLSP